MKRIEDFRKEIEKALRRAGKYSKSLGPQIMSLSGALRTIELANHELDELDCTTIPVVNRYGSEGFAPHPVFKILKDAQDSVTRQMKALGLTAEDLAGMDENDPLIELTKKVSGVGRKAARIVRRDPSPASGGDGGQIGGGFDEGQAGEFASVKVVRDD